MELYESIFHVLLGGAIGYVLGRFHSYLRDIKEELDEVDEIVKHPKGEGGFMRSPIAADIAVVITVALCVWAAFSTQITNNKLERTQGDLTSTQSELKNAQEAIERLSVCNQKYLTQTVVALNDRTTFTQERADANVKVQKAESEFWKFLLTQPPPPPNASRDALREYLVLIDEFVEASDKANINLQVSPYPTDKELAACYSDADEVTEEDKNATE